MATPSMPCYTTQGPNTSGQGWRSRAFGTTRAQGFCLFLHLPNANNPPSQQVAQAKIPVFVFLCSFLHVQYQKVWLAFLLIDPICPKQIQIVSTCYHILYQKSSWIFCDSTPANVSVVNSSMMHFERVKKYTSYFLQHFLLLLPCSGNHP